MAKIATAPKSMEEIRANLMLIRAILNHTGKDFRRIMKENASKKDYWKYENLILDSNECVKTIGDMIKTIESVKA